MNRDQLLAKLKVPIGFASGGKPPVLDPGYRFVTVAEIDFPPADAEFFYQGGPQWEESCEKNKIGSTNLFYRTRTPAPEWHVGHSDSRNHYELPPAGYRFLAAGERITAGMETHAGLSVPWIPVLPTSVGNLPCACCSFRTKAPLVRPTVAFVQSLAPEATKPVVEAPDHWDPYAPFNPLPAGEEMPSGCRLVTRAERFFLPRDAQFVYGKNAWSFSQYGGRSVPDQDKATVYVTAEPLPEWHIGRYTGYVGDGWRYLTKWEFESTVIVRPSDLEFWDRVSKDWVKKGVGTDLRKWTTYRTQLPLVYRRPATAFDVAGASEAAPAVETVTMGSCAPAPSISDIRADVQALNDRLAAYIEALEEKCKVLESKLEASRAVSKAVLARAHKAERELAGL